MRLRRHQRPRPSRAARSRRTIAHVEEHQRGEREALGDGDRGAGRRRGGEGLALARWRRGPARPARRRPRRRPRAASRAGLAPALRRRRSAASTSPSASRIAAAAQVGRHLAPGRRAPPRAASPGAASVACSVGHLGQNTEPCPSPEPPGSPSSSSARSPRSSSRSAATPATRSSSAPSAWRPRSTCCPP